MDYQTLQPHPDLEPLISCYWTLTVPKTEHPEKQRIIPDGTIEMAFILGDDIKRYTAKGDVIIQPRALILGHTIEPFFIEPTGSVDTFAIRFYPYGFANFVSVPINALANTETPLAQLFDEVTANKLAQDIIHAKDTEQQIKIIELFLIHKLNDSTPINTILKDNLSKRRQLERKFIKQIGVSPKQLGKLIRLQSALKAMLNEDEDLTQIAHQNSYYDQSHFIKDFKEFTGVSPKEFVGNESMALSSLFYK
jgi:AraC-like DNA-binding protein